MRPDHSTTRNQGPQPQSCDPTVQCQSKETATYGIREGQMLRQWEQRIPIGPSKGQGKDNQARDD